MANYKGDYTVKPKTIVQILETDKKTMENDVTVKAVPYSMVDNAAGGQTVTIGG